MPSTLTRAAGHPARSAVACLVCFTSIALTACGHGSHFPSAIDRADAAPSSSGTGAHHDPLISGKPLTTAVVNVPYVFRPDVNDPDGDVLVFEIASAPAWASFYPATGQLSGTPPAGTTGTYTGIVISVSDGRRTTSLAPFSILLTTTTAPATNSAPTITGTPRSSSSTSGNWESETSSLI